MEKYMNVVDTTLEDVELLNEEEVDEYLGDFEDDIDDFEGVFDDETETITDSEEV